jgi:hypothetical protein
VEICLQKDSSSNAVFLSLLKASVSFLERNLHMPFKHLPSTSFLCSSNRKKKSECESNFVLQNFENCEAYLSDESQWTSQSGTRVTLIRCIQGSSTCLWLALYNGYRRVGPILLYLKTPTESVSETSYICIRSVDSSQRIYSLDDFDRSHKCLEPKNLFNLRNAWGRGRITAEVRTVPLLSGLLTSVPLQ